MSDLSLRHYDPKKDIIVASDASNLNLGAVILHKESIDQVIAIAHALRTLLPAEKEYSQIKKEALRIIFAVKMKFIPSKRACGWVIQQGSYLPTPPLGQDMTQGQFLSRF